MSRRVPPHINASLIREMRMIAQQLFGGREDNYYAMRASEARAKAQAEAAKAQAVMLKCGKCMEITSKPNDAITIYKGTALCRTCASLAMAPRNRDS